MYVVYQTSEPVDFVTSRGSSPRHSDAIPSARDACASPVREIRLASRPTLGQLSATSRRSISATSRLREPVCEAIVRKGADAIRALRRQPRNG